MPDRVNTQMIALLNRERTAIRTGDFEQLASIADKKATLIDALSTSQTSQSDLAQIKRLIEENQTLLSAAISGVAAAQDRLAALRHVREGLSIYDQSGQIAKVQSPKPDMEKKA